MYTILCKKRWIALLLIFLLVINLSSFISISVKGIQVEDILMYTPKSESRIKYGKPVLIRGIWHYVNITLNSKLSEISLIFYFGSTPINVNNRNETNYYIWEYNQGSWKDSQHDSKYINEGYCSYDDESFSFYLGIDQYSKLGNWTLELSTNNDLLISQQIFVDNAITSLILKTTPVIIEVEPFTEDSYISNNKFTVENRGNVPLRLSVSYGRYENIFSTINFTEILKPGGKKKYNILLQSRSTWKPGLKQIKAGETILKGELQNIISPKSIVSLISSNVSIGLPINIYIGRSGFVVESLVRDITFSYVDSIDIYYNEIEDIFSYISGNGSIIVDVSGKNLDIIQILSGGTEVSPPFRWRDWPALIDEDSECCRAQRRLLTTRCHRYIIAAKNNEGQDASL